MYNHRFCEWNGSKWQVWNIYLELLEFSFFISYLASPQIEMCHCGRKVEHEHKCSFITKQKHTDKQEDDENSFSGEIKFKLKMNADEDNPISWNLFYTVGVSCFIIIIFF